MSIKSNLRTYLIYQFLVLFLITACQKDEEGDKHQYDFLVAYNSRNNFASSTIKVFLSTQLFMYPELTDIIENVKYDVQIYKISYKTQCYDSLIIASGLFCLPTTEGKFPVICFQNGTITDHYSAPSVSRTDKNYLMMEFMASHGYIVLIADYAGFGSTEDMLHPYYHRTPTNNVIIDLIHAFGEVSLKDSILAAGNDTIYLMGYSQGGWATISALDEIEYSIPDINIAAVSCGAGAYDLLSMSEYILGLYTFPGPLYLPYFIYSQQFYGNITDPLSMFFKEPYARKIPELFNGSYDNYEIIDQLTYSIPDLVTADLRENFSTDNRFSELRELLTENSVSGWNTSAKINLYHGTSDMNVPPQQSSNLRNSFINNGTDPGKINYIPLEGYTHGTGVVPWGILTINWFRELENK